METTIKATTEVVRDYGCLFVNAVPSSSIWRIARSPVRIGQRLATYILNVYTCDGRGIHEQSPNF